MKILLMVFSFALWVGAECARAVEIACQLTISSLFFINLAGIWMRCPGSWNMDEI